MTIPDKSVRPATDRVKGSIFNSLQNRIALSGSSVLDLFAGTGNLGFEALSRGAQQVVFVDENGEVLDIIEKNAEKLNCLDATEIIQTDALSFIQKTDKQFNLIFADPPYEYEMTKDIPKIVFGKTLLKKEGYLIIEHSKRTQFDISPLYAIETKKEFGNTQVSFFIHPKEKGDEQ